MLQLQWEVTLSYRHYGKVQSRVLKMAVSLASPQTFPGTWPHPTEFPTFIRSQGRSQTSSSSHTTWRRVTSAQAVRDFKLPVGISSTPAVSASERSSMNPRTTTCCWPSGDVCNAFHSSSWPATWSSAISGAGLTRRRSSSRRTTKRCRRQLAVSLTTARRRYAAGS